MSVRLTSLANPREEEAEGWKREKKWGLRHTRSPRVNFDLYGTSDVWSHSWLSWGRGT